MGSSENQRLAGEYTSKIYIAKMEKLGSKHFTGSEVEILLEVFGEVLVKV